ncbi:MAG: hypothetical protein ACOYJE_07110, partial [Bacteroidaceae bacterium]
LWVGTAGKGEISSDYRYQGCSIRPVFGTDSTTVRHDSPLDTVDRRVDMGVLSDSGKPLYWASGNLVVRRYARSYIAHEPTFVPEHRIFNENALEWDLFCWGDITGKEVFLSQEWELQRVSSLPENISGDARYDIARAQLGGAWRLPTENEWRQLLDNCELTYDSVRGRYCVWLTSKINGNVLCFYDSRAYAMETAIPIVFREVESEFFCGTHATTAHLNPYLYQNLVTGELFRMPDIRLYYETTSMGLVRPVTE